MPLSKIVAPCGRPATVPTAASVPSFWMRVNALPIAGVNPHFDVQGGAGQNHLGGRTSVAFSDKCRNLISIFHV
jgi:hypothetical protein